ncbi:MAG: IS1380 family transposase [bacterium]|nr:IS1380 family transposase [bacterium]
MKRSKADVVSHRQSIPELRFEDQQLSSFAGLVVLQALIRRLDLRGRLRGCFRPSGGRAFAPHLIFLWLIVHLFIGYRRLRDRDFYHDDPVVKRTVGVKYLPDVATISRSLGEADEFCVERVRQLSVDLVLERIIQEELPRVTIDFDGSVQSTQGHLEGTAVGYNKQKKGRRSYYPLFATVAQTQQFLDLLHRPGNVHDSRGARDFMQTCFETVREACPGVQLESRMDAAFFDQKILFALDDQRVEFTASVPFERLVALKGIVEQRKRWRRLDDTWAYFEMTWKPKSWDRSMRFVFLRQRAAKQHKEPLQLDLFAPRDYTYQYTVIVTNKTIGAQSVARFHHGRGSQEGIFADGKSSAQLDYLPVRKLHGNQLYTLAAMIAHNLAREIQMTAYERERGATQKRAPHWQFESLRRLRQRLIQRAGRLTRPGGKLTLTMNANETLRDELTHLLDTQIAA